MNIDTWLHDPKAHDEHYALPSCPECGDEIEDGGDCPDCVDTNPLEEEK